MYSEKSSTFEHVISCAKSRAAAAAALSEISSAQRFEQLLTDSYHFSHKRSNVPNF